MSQLDERERLAASMRRQRWARGWTMRQVADRAGLDVSQISRAESGLRRPLAAAVQAGVFETTEADVRADCPHCRYRPPSGYMCLTCGSKGKAFIAGVDHG